MGAEQISVAQFPTIRREDAQRFLLALDDRTNQFTLQLFDDVKGQKGQTPSSYFERPGAAGIAAHHDP
jgi:hypothetical protein